MLKEIDFPSSAFKKFFGIAAVFFLVIGSFLVLWHISQVLSYGEVWGTVSEIYIMPRRGGARGPSLNNADRGRYFVKYTVDGTEYESLIRRPSDDADIGTPALVRYKKTDPRTVLYDSRVVPDSPLLFIIPGFVCLGLIEVINFRDKYDHPDY